VNLGEGSGLVQGELSTIFTHSVLVTVRYPLPWDLKACCVNGVVRVYEDGHGLLIGDVLRACSTLELRYDSARGETCIGSGFRGRVRPGDGVPEETAGWLQRAVTRLVGGIAGAPRPRPGLLPELQPFRETSPTKVLFLADGQSDQRVTDALAANTADKVQEVVMLFERPVEIESQLPVEQPSSKSSFAPLTDSDISRLFKDEGRPSGDDWG